MVANQRPGAAAGLYDAKDKAHFDRARRLVENARGSYSRAGLQTSELQARMAELDDLQAEFDAQEKAAMAQAAEQVRRKSDEAAASAAATAAAAVAAAAEGGALAAGNSSDVCTGVGEANAACLAAKNDTGKYPLHPSDAIPSAPLPSDAASKTRAQAATNTTAERKAWDADKVASGKVSEAATSRVVTALPDDASHHVTGRAAAAPPATPAASLKNESSIKQASGSAADMGGTEKTVPRSGVDQKAGADDRKPPSVTAKQVGVGMGVKPVLDADKRQTGLQVEMKAVFFPSLFPRVFPWNDVAWFALASFGLHAKCTR